MSRKSFDKTLDFIRSLDQARSPGDVCAELLKIAGRFGFEHVLAGTIPTPGSSTVQQKSHVVLNYWPSGWAQRYFAHGYLFRDPAIRRVTESTTPFEWGELDRFCLEDPAARRVMDEAGDFRLKAGFTVPLITLDGQTAGFSLAGERMELSPEGRGMLTLLATYALGRAIELLEAPSDSDPIHLTLREREALQWAAEGKSEAEIGEIMRISEHGVDKHMRAIRLKLGTRTRTHAVAEAIRKRLIV